MRSVADESYRQEIYTDIALGDLAPDGYQWRPDIVWFEEPVPMIEEAIPIVQSADFFAVVGTSLVVYPAAGLLNYAYHSIPKFIVDKKVPQTKQISNLTIIEQPATIGVPLLHQFLLEAIK